MGERPYVLLSCSMSIDGYLDGVAEERLLLSNDADFDRVDAVRATCDAILVGARTIRRDNPRLLVRAEHRRKERVAAGRSPNPIKVTLTENGTLDECGNFFTAGDADKIVYCAGPAYDDVVARLGKVATVVDAGHPIDLRMLVEDLHCRGVRRLMVEGGGTVHTQFLTADLADELHLVVAPRFVGDGRFPWNPDRRAALAGVTQIGDVVLLRYALSERFTGATGAAPGAAFGIE